MRLDKTSHDHLGAGLGLGEFLDTGFGARLCLGEFFDPGFGASLGLGEFFDTGFGAGLGLGEFFDSWSSVNTSANVRVRQRAASSPSGPRSSSKMCLVSMSAPCHRGASRPVPWAPGILCRNQATREIAEKCTGVHVSVKGRQAA